MSAPERNDQLVSSKLGMLMSPEIGRNGGMWNNDRHPDFHSRISLVAFEIFEVKN